MAQRRTQEKEAEQQNKSTHAFRSMRISHSTVGEDASVTVCCQDENADGRGVWKKAAAHNQNRFCCYNDMTRQSFFAYNIFLQNIFSDLAIYVPFLHLLWKWARNESYNRLFFTLVMRIQVKPLENKQILSRT